MIHYVRSTKFSLFPSSGRPKNSVLMELVKKPCLISDINATEHLTNARVTRDKIHACDGNTSTFYHSIENTGDRNPFFTISLNGRIVIKTITVVNVHTGKHCIHDAQDCTMRIHGAKVEVMLGLLVFCLNHMITKAKLVSYDLYVQNNTAINLHHFIFFRRCCDGRMWRDNSDE